MRALCQAVPKPWFWSVRGGFLKASVNGPHLAYIGATPDLKECLATGYYLEAANPQAVLDLLDELAAVKAERDALATKVSQLREDMLCKRKDGWCSPYEVCAKALPTTPEQSKDPK
jgi:hypothetical protein